ncbi:LysR family transcriptional regulator [Erwinia rhapontici]|uniref:LysR family transcriptional regulator n=1 Tax=Erwinia rhapontici TaxID=55212 RepID=UPI0013312152|nr:LysR family transcriptional regulator [Erwinia rhapontici]MBP2156549.1 DNA-binding transcriptional LysR family regulator [Erwinia rhapontici]
MADLRTLDLNLLKTLDALLDECSVTRAAQRLALTQPAVSGMLTRLRECFNDPLFIRNRHGITPTLRALELAAPVKQILAEVSLLLQPKVFDAARAQMSLRIAATDYALSAVVVPFITALRQQAPGVRVSVQSVVNEQLAAQMAQGEVDMALVTPETTPPDLHAHPLFEEQYVCLLRTGHPDAASGALSLDRFCALDHALVSHSGTQFRGVTDEALATLGRERRVTLAVNSFLVLPEILRSSDLIAVVPQRLALHTHGLIQLAPPLTIVGFSKSVVWHERSHRDPGHRWLRTLLLKMLTH